MSGAGPASRLGLRTPREQTSRAEFGTNRLAPLAAHEIQVAIGTEGLHRHVINQRPA